MQLITALAHLNATLAQAGSGAPEIDAASAGLMAGAGILGIIGFVIGLANLVLWIIVLVKQFQNDPAWHGIVGIVTCSIYTFIWGWINSTRLNLKKIMLVWTACWVVGVGIQVVSFALIGGAAAKQIQMDAARRESAPVPAEQN